MKFFIYLSLLILVLSPFTSVFTKRSKKSKHFPSFRKPIMHSSRPVSSVTNISRPYVSSSSVAVSRPTTVLTSSPTLISGPPQGPRFGYVAPSFPLRFYGVRRYAILRRSLTSCPLEHEMNLFVEKVDGRCLSICTRLTCIQTLYSCCYYKSSNATLI